MVQNRLVLGCGEAYYFLQIDNGAKVGVPGDKKNGGNYTKRLIGGILG